MVSFGEAADSDVIRKERDACWNPGTFRWLPPCGGAVAAHLRRRAPVLVDRYPLTMVRSRSQSTAFAVSSFAGSAHSLNFSAMHASYAVGESLSE